MSGVFEHLVRVNQTREIGPPRKATRGQCEEEPRTVIIEMGKSALARVQGTSYSISIQRYMTKQQKELQR